jgi:hypothetical protein
VLDAEEQLKKYKAQAGCKQWKSISMWSMWNKIEGNLLEFHRHQDEVQKTSKSIEYRSM